MIEQGLETPEIIRKLRAKFKLSQKQAEEVVKYA